jgi:hypothetical protein
MISSIQCNLRKITTRCLHPINFQDPIETFFKQIENEVHYTNAGMQPHIEEHYVNIVFLLIQNTGAVHDACRYWQRRTPVNQTWEDFRREFARSQREQRIILNTATCTLLQLKKS